MGTKIFEASLLTIVMGLVQHNPMALAEEFEVDQKGKRFSVAELTIKIGDSVKFTNSDPFFHNIFSLSDTKLFDLGAYGKGEHETVTFEEAGEIDIECAIHPSMQLHITVQ